MKNKSIILCLASVIVLLLIGLFIQSFTNPWKVINDLRKELPREEFTKVSIVSVTPSKDKDIELVLFEIPDSKMKRFEEGFWRCIKSATPTTIQFLKAVQLRIQTTNGKYTAYIYYDDNEITFYNSLKSKELRKVFYNAGLKYSSERQDVQEIGKEVNQP